MNSLVKSVIITTFLFFSFNLCAQEIGLEWGHNTGAGNMDEGLGICLDDNNNLYTIGYFQGTADFDPSTNTANLISNGQADIYLASYDEEGNYRWGFNIGGSGWDSAWNVKNHNNYLYITGYFEGTADFDPSANTANLISNGQADIYIACYDTDGNYQWAYGIGSTGWDTGNNIAVDHSGNPIIVCGFEGTVDFDPSANTANLTELGNGDMCIAKYNPDGTFQWAINPSGTMWDRGNSIAADYNGNVYVVGNFEGTVDFDPSANTAELTSQGSNDISICSYDQHGNYRWAGSSGGVGSDMGFSICSETYTNGQIIFFTGDFEETGDFDPTGGTANLTSNGDKDIFVTAMTTNGDFLWSIAVGGQHYDSAYYITNDDEPNIFITGDTRGGDFDPSGNTAAFPGLGSSDIFIASYNWQGNYRGATVFGGPNMEFGNSIAVDNPIYLLADFYGIQTDFDPTTIVNIIPSNGDIDIFLGKYDSSQLDVENTNELPIQLKLNENYPNPFNPTTTIEYNIPHDSHVTIEIYNINGKLINRLVNHFKRAGTYSINWNGLDSYNQLVSSGTYFYKLKSNGVELSKKMILLR